MHFYKPESTLLIKFNERHFRKAMIKEMTTLFFAFVTMFKLRSQISYIFIYRGISKRLFVWRADSSKKIFVLVGLQRLEGFRHRCAFRKSLRHSTLSAEFFSDIIIKISIYNRVIEVFCVFAVHTDHCARMADRRNGYDFITDDNTRKKNN